MSVKSGEPNLAKFTLLTSTLGPSGSFKDLFRCKRESEMRKATGSYRTYRSLEKRLDGFMKPKSVDKFVKIFKH